MIYYKDCHFTSRFWDTHGNIWFHNGRVHQGAWVKDVDPDMTSEEKRSQCREAKVVQAIYTAALSNLDQYDGISTAAMLIETCNLGHVNIDHNLHQFFNISPEINVCPTTRKMCQNLHEYYPFVG